MFDAKSTFRLRVSILLMLLASQASAGIYSWTDGSGKVHFGDRPPIGREADPITVRVNTFESASVIPRTDDLTGSRSKVVLYTTQRCGYCRKAKQFLDRENIRYTEYDVETSNKGKRDYEKLNGRGVPIILVGDQRMNGFNEARMASLLKSAGYTE